MPIQFTPEGAVFTTSNPTASARHATGAKMAFGLGRGILNTVVGGSNIGSSILSGYSAGQLGGAHSNLSANILGEPRPNFSPVPSGGSSTSTTFVPGGDKTGNPGFSPVASNTHDGGTPDTDNDQVDSASTLKQLQSGLAQQFALQVAVNSITQYWGTLSSVNKTYHDTCMSMIQNMR